MKNIDRLHDLLNAVPFAEIQVNTNSGGHFPIAHRENVAIAQDGKEIAIYSHGNLAIIETENISEIVRIGKAGRGK